MTADARIMDEAIGWHLRQPSMTAADWLAFTDWLEADAAHAAAYDRVALADRMMPIATFEAPSAASEPAPTPVLPVAANDDAPRARHWRRVLGGSVAAAVAAVLIVPLALPHGPAPYAVETAAGERRVVALGDGTRIEMGGDTRLTLDRHDDRVAVLDRGQALFTVRHDADHPFTLTAGTVEIRDLGTVFDVAVTGKDRRARLAVQVAEGSVMVRPDRAPVVLTRGQTLTTDMAGGHELRGTVAPEEVGGWRDGRIALTDATLGDLADAWRARFGTRVTLGGELPHRPFSGMVTLTGRAERDVPHMAALIGADWRREGDDWIIEAPGGRSR